MYELSMCASEKPTCASTQSVPARAGTRLDSNTRGNAARVRLMRTAYSGGEARVSVQTHLKPHQTHELAAVAVVGQGAVLAPAEVCGRLKRRLRRRYLQPRNACLRPQTPVRTATETRLHRRYTRVRLTPHHGGVLGDLRLPRSSQLSSVNASTRVAGQWHAPVAWYCIVTASELGPEQPGTPLLTAAGAPASWRTAATAPT